MVDSGSLCDGSRLISRDSLDGAIALTEFLKTSLRHLFAEEFAFGKPMQDRQRVLRHIRDHAGCKRRDILRNCSILVKELWPILGTLKEEGRVLEGAGDTYWPEGADVPGDPQPKDRRDAPDCPDCGQRHSPDADCIRKVVGFPS
jgi:hypothetical protein